MASGHCRALQIHQDGSRKNPCTHYNYISVHLVKGTYNTGLHKCLLYLGNLICVYLE